MVGAPGDAYSLDVNVIVPDGWLFFCTGGHSVQTSRPHTVNVGSVGAVPSHCLLFHV